MYVLIVLFSVALIYYLKYRKSKRLIYEFADSLPDAGGLPVLGHTHWFIGGPETLMANIQKLVRKHEQLDVPITKLWIGPKLYIIPFDLDEAKTILEDCLEKDYSYKFLRNWLGNGLFVAPMDMWKTQRRMLLPAFHTRFTEDYIEVFGQQGNILNERLQKISGQEFDVYEYITSCFLDIVFEAAIGEKMDVQGNPDTPYLCARKAMISIISMRMFKPWMQPDSLFNLTPYSKLQKDSIDLTHQFTNEVIKRKREEMEKGIHINKNGRKDMLEVLLSRNPSYTNEELREHIDSITIAGNDTTALVIAYVLVLLGLHEKDQAKVYDEIKTIFGDSMRMPTKEDLNKMEYLERVIKETMRLYPPVPLIARVTTREVKLSSCTVPAGVGCGVLPFMFHRSKIWGADADLFKPDRFLPENWGNKHPCAYMPFSHGVRNCIGRQFGMLAMKSVLANVIRSYEITSKSMDRFKIEILMFPVAGHIMTLKKREF